MIERRQLVKIIIMVGISGMLSACQNGHSFSTRYHNGVPVPEKAKSPSNPIPIPKDKPKARTQKTPKILKAKGSAKTFTVRKGDTIYALSRRHDVTVRGIIQANGLNPPYLLQPGQKLKSPVTGFHIVKKGDTVYSLSRKYRVDMTILTRLNGLNKPYVLAVGQKLTVPGFRKKSSNRQISLPPPPPQSGKGFLWPVKGQLLSSFGPKNVGYHNDGINIAAKSGSYVRAAESGVVVHAGSKIKGFGKLILIRHSNGWITAYAHNASLLIKKGQSVKRGQAIARVGQSGGVDRPQLHFEMRKGARAVNPVRYLVS